MELLEKIRAITGILNKASGLGDELNDICEILAGLFNSEVRLYDILGKTIASANVGMAQCLESQDDLFAINALSPPILSWMVAIERMIINVPLCRSPLCVDKLGADVCGSCNEKALFNPVYASGKRMATLLIVTRAFEDFTQQDEALVEIASSACGSIMQYSKICTDAESITAKNIAKNALHSLSYSEAEAAIRMFKQLNGDEGVLVASRIAIQAGVARSAIVSALKKLEVAGVVESRSLGMKGTFIRIKNEYILQELEYINV